jgi:hypothetical protein
MSLTILALDNPILILVYGIVLKGFGSADEKSSLSYTNTRH